jgi:MFS family permease
MEWSLSHDEAHLIRERSTSHRSCSAKDDLRARVPSLLILQNEHYPPRTSPEHKRNCYSTEGSRATSSDVCCTLTPFEHYLGPVMAINRFDGPAGQIEDDAPHTARRHLSQPDIVGDASSRAEGESAQPLSGLNQRHAGTAVSQEQGGSADLPPMPQRSPFNRTSGRYKPHYDVRTLPPATPRLTESSLRPGMQHVPGSYQSDFGSKNLLESGSYMAVDVLEDDQTQKQPYGSHTLLPSSAVESLSHAQGHQDSLPTRPPVRSVRSNTSLHRKMSQASLKPTFSSRALPRTHAALPYAGQIAQPVATPATDQEYSQEATRPARIQPMPETQVEFPSRQSLEKVPQHSRELVPVTETQLSDLLAQLPPFRQQTLEGFSHPPLVSKSPSDYKQHLEPQLRREHSREVSSHDEREDQTFKDRLDLPAKATEQLNRVPEERRTPGVVKVQSPSIPGTPVSSASHKAASLSRALTALSEISSKSNGSRHRLPLPRSSSKYEKLDDHIDELNVPGRSQEGEKRSSWVQNFLGRSSTIATPEAPNLTARPSQQHSRALIPTEHLRSAMMPASPGSVAASDENALHDKSVDDAMRNLAIAKQQQHNEESFSKVILDLENLLREALIIAHQAADGNKITDGRGQDCIPQADHLVGSDSSSEVFSEAGSMRPAGHDEEDHYTSAPRIITHPAHEHVTVLEPKSEERYHGHFRKARDATPYPAASRNPSVVPPVDQDEPPREPEQPKPTNDNGLLQPFVSRDWALAKRQPTMRNADFDNVPLLPRQPTMAQAPLKEQNTFLARKQKPSSNALSEQAVHQYIENHQKPPVQPRASSFRLRPRQRFQESSEALEMEKLGVSREGSEMHDQSDFEDPDAKHYKSRPKGSTDRGIGRDSALSPLPDGHYELEDRGPAKQDSIRKGRRSHFSIKEPQGFSLSRSHKRAPIARDWSDSRKRWTATIACLSTALIGVIIGIYAGEVPAIQYAIVDEHHYTILGNVVFFIGLAITTVVFFPLPLLHGRKPYTLAALAILLPLQFPQALAVNAQRTPSVATYRVGLLLSRSIAGLVVGFANINFLSTLLDLFGASLQSSNPHEEEVDINDVRRHGGGMGMWLGIWTWCFIGSIGVGFLIGAVIISALDVSWGFWITIILTAAVLVLNVLAPETRRSAYRRSLAEVHNGGEVSRRIARGEIKMHLDATGPIYWWEEVTAGLRLCMRMLKQPGFAILSLYLGWIYGQIVIVIVVS